MVFKKENKIHHECPYLGSVCSWKLEESKVSKKRRKNTALYTYPQNIQTCPSLRSRH